MIASQHGFCSGRSILSAAVEFIESIALLLVILMDFSKAFDSVDHSVMIEKLKLLGINKLFKQGGGLRGTLAGAGAVPAPLLWLSTCGSEARAHVQAREAPWLCQQPQLQ